MNNKKYISVSEYAEIKNISKQAVYKRLNKSLKNFLIEVDGKKYIDRAALTDFENENFNEVKQPIKQKFNNQIQPFLENQIIEKDKQIENLFKQIEEKDKQIEELHTLLNQSQRLQAAGNKLLQDNSKGKKGIFKLFGRKKEESE